MKRKELTAYDKWLTRRKWRTGEIISPEKAADLYLAEHPLPPAEGAEEILHKYVHTINSDGTSLVTFMGALKAMREFATLHAQKIADKMVEATKDCYPKEFVEWKDKKELRYSSLHNRYYSDTDNGMREFTLDELFYYWKEDEK